MRRDRLSVTRATDGWWRTLGRLLRPRFRCRPAPGQAIVELALAFPLFVLVLFGIISGSWLFFQQQSVVNAARSAARDAAILNPLFVNGASGGCEPTAAQASPAQTIEAAAQSGSALVSINSSQICGSSGGGTTMSSSTSNPSRATVTVTASPTLDSPNTVTVTVTYVAHPLSPIWPTAAVTLTGTSTVNAQSGP